MLRKLWLMILVSVMPTVLPAEAPLKTFQGQATVQVIEVPVRVVDPESGRAVRGLEASDFQIFENGEEMAISNFAEIDAGSAAPAVRDAVPAARAEPRQMIYFFDLYLMSRLDRDRAVEALRQEYQQGLHPLELVSIAAFDGKMHALLDSSRDRAAILEALDEVGGLKTHGRAQRIVFGEALTTREVSGERKLDYYERRQRSREYMTELERRIERVGNALSMALQRFAALDGRKIMVIFSPGQPETSWSPSYSPVDYINGEVAYPAQDLWKGLGLVAAELGFTLYVVDSSGLRVGSAADATTGITSGVSAFGGGSGANRLPESQSAAAAVADPGSTQAPRNLGKWLERTRKNMLIDASDLTGGEAVFSTSVREAVSGIEKAWRHWYSLAYTVDHPAVNEENRIEVRLRNHPEYLLQYRRAYRKRSVGEQDAEKMRSAMLFGADANPLGIRVEFGEPESRFHLGASRAKRIRVPVEVKIPLGGLEFLPQGDIYSARVLLSFFSRDEKGNQSPLAREEQPIQVEKSRFEEAMRGGYFTYRITLEVEGGKQSLSVGVEDELSRKRSIISRDFEF